MDQIVGNFAFPGESLHLEGKFRHIPEELILPNGFLRPRYDVDDSSVLAQGDDAGNVGILGASENIHADSLPAQLSARLPNINIHSSGFFPTQGGQGTTVYAKHCDALHFLTALIW
jgi:hypothetical protein